MGISHCLWKMPKVIAFPLYLGKNCLVCHADKGTLEWTEFKLTAYFVSIFESQVLNLIYRS